MTGYFAALLLTLAVEPPLYAVGLRRLLDVPARRGYVHGLLANGTSHVLAWIVLFPLGPDDRPFATVVAVEAFVVAWEAVFLRLRLRRDLGLLVGLSFVVNAVSIALGAVTLR